MFVICAMPAIVAGPLERIEGCVSREVRYFKWRRRFRVRIRCPLSNGIAPSLRMRLRVKDDMNRT